MRILVVEDEALIRMLIVEMLEEDRDIADPGRNRAQ